MGKNYFKIQIYETTNEHSKIYGFDAQRPIFVQTIVSKHRCKGIGKVFKYIVEHAIKNRHDLIFGHINEKANIDIIKSMLVKAGFNTIEGNNDFYKITI